MYEEVRSGFFFFYITCYYAILSKVGKLVRPMES